MTKTPRAAPLLPLLLLFCLFGLTSCQQENMEPPQEPPQPLALTMSLQYYDKLGNYLEVPTLSGGEPTEDLALISQELDRYAQELQARVDALNTSNEPGFLRCLCLPVSGERYLSLVLFEYNEQADNLLTEGPALHSWVYDQEEGRLVTEDEALAMAETTLDEIFKQILRQHTSPPRPPEELDLLGFLLSKEGTPTFFLNAWVPVTDGQFSYLYTWSQGELTRLYTYDLPFFSLNLDRFDPPLYHQWYSDWDSQPPGGFNDPPFNEYTIPKLLAEEAMSIQLNTTHSAPEVLARRTAGPYTLLLILQDSGVHAGGLGNLALGVWDSGVQAFTGEFWTLGGDYGLCASWEEEGAYYLLCANTGAGSGWEGSSGTGWFRFDETGLEQLTTLPDFAREALPELPDDAQLFDDTYEYDWHDDHKILPVPGGMELYTRNEDYNAARPGTRQWDYTGFVPLSREAAEYRPAAEFLREQLWARELEGDDYASFFGPYLHISEVSAVENGWQFGIVNRSWNSNGFPSQFTLTVAGGGQGWTILEDIPVSGG